MGPLCCFAPTALADYPIHNYYPNTTDYAKTRINDSPDNTFRGLRVVNATHNFLYGEVTTLHDWFFEAIAFHELYRRTAVPCDASSFTPDSLRAMPVHSDHCVAGAGDHLLLLLLLFPCGVCWQELTAATFL